jgi:hypothetical protein
MYSASGARVRRKARRQRSSGPRYYALQSLIGSDQDDIVHIRRCWDCFVRLLLPCHAECRWHGAASFSHTSEVAPRFAEVLLLAESLPKS